MDLWTVTVCSMSSRFFSNYHALLYIAGANDAHGLSLDQRSHVPRAGIACDVLIREFPHDWSAANIHRAIHLHLISSEQAARLVERWFQILNSPASISFSPKSVSNVAYLHVCYNLLIKLAAVLWQARIFEDEELRLNHTRCSKPLMPGSELRLFRCKCLAFLCRSEQRYMHYMHMRGLD